ncbi:AIPR family protein [Undibacterium sp. Ji50W]|uniref:AIPR family protein n=1 Tax=Undibacterium sp. Ji50W TaxID=3413041 RepID=UPI003BF065A5
MTMTLRQQIVQSNIEQTSKHLSLSNEDSFVRLAHMLITDQSIHSFEKRDLVDGGQDKQIDVISIMDEADEGNIFILQVKNTGSFESNILIQMRNGLQWIFSKTRTDIEQISNKNFKDQILAYRALQSSVGPSNIHVQVAYVTNATGTDVSDECRQEMKTIVDEYDNEVFASFKFELWSANEIVDRINALDKKNKKISTSVKIRYDANTPSLIKYQTQGLTGIVCSVPAQEIANIVNEDVNGYVFDMNIRKYLGNRGSVNPEILSTCSSVELSYLFWFLNNGITIVCDKIDPITDPDDPHIKLTNMQIVNGCQTASSLARAATKGMLQKDTRVLVKFFQAGNNDLVDRIVLTTNNQNKISGRNLRSNDFVQADLEKGFLIYDLFYERKPRQFDNEPNATKNNVISNDTVATAYLAIVLKRCSDARSRKYKVWGEFYEKIFEGGAVEPYVLSSLIHARIKDCLLQDKYTENTDSQTRFLGKNASFHIARIGSFLFRKTDSWTSVGVLKTQINELVTGQVDMDDLTDKSFKILFDLVSKFDSRDLNSILKSNALDSGISRTLHTTDRDMSNFPLDLFSE